MRFSIIVPMYNVEKYAKKCIESILIQSYDNYELIIVDDGSTDQTAAIIDSFAKKNSRILPIHKANGGLVSARKIGAKIARGEYIIIVDGDDWVDKDYLFYLNKIINKHHPDMICCNYYQNSTIKENKYNHLNEGMNYRSDIQAYMNDSLFDILPTLWAKAIKNSLYKRFQLKVSNIISMGEDSVVTIPMLTKCNSVYISRECFYHYRYNPNSMTKTKNRLISGCAALKRIDLLSKEIPQFSSKDQHLSAYTAHALIGVAISYFRNYDYFLSCKKIRKLLNTDIILKYMKIFPLFGTKQEIVAWILLKYRCFVIIKLLSIIW